MSYQDKPKRPTCEDCGAGLECRHCDDTRPTAEDLGPGWKLETPFGRLELVERVTQENDYAPVIVYTKESGPDFGWDYPRWRKVNAVRPRMIRPAAVPVIRVVEGYGRDGMMWVHATREDIGNGRIYTDSESILAEAGYVRGQGWWVRTSKTSGTRVIIGNLGSKAEARRELRNAARQIAKRLKVKLVIVPNT